MIFCYSPKSFDLLCGIAEDAEISVEEMEVFIGNKDEGMSISYGEEEVAHALVDLMEGWVVRRWCLGKVVTVGVPYILLDSDSDSRFVI